MNILAFRLRKPPGTVVTWLSLVALFMLSIAHLQIDVDGFLYWSLAASLGNCTPLTFCFLRLHSVHDVVVLSARG